MSQTHSTQNTAHRKQCTERSNTAHHTSQRCSTADRAVHRKQTNTNTDKHKHRVFVRLSLSLFEVVLEFVCVCVCLCLCWCLCLRFLRVCLCIFRLQTRTPQTHRHTDTHTHTHTGQPDNVVDLGLRERRLTRCRRLKECDVAGTVLLNL
jgi:hypothetical protein